MRIGVGHPVFSIRGKIDRVDRLTDGDGPPVFLLVDYKSGARKLHLGRISEGLDLQLLTYALAYREAARRRQASARIGGVVYWPLSASIQAATLEDPAAATTMGLTWFKKRNPSALFDETIYSALDAQVQAQESSPVFGFSRTKGGDLNRRGQNHWPTDSIDPLLQFERDLIERRLAEIVNGRVAPMPFRQGQLTACRDCDYQAFCRKADPYPLDFHPIPNLKREQMLAMLL